MAHKTMTWATLRAPAAVSFSVTTAVPPTVRMLRHDGEPLARQ
jgi:hypothetical protein